MRMNRRNVLVGLGTIVAGGGGALATGAFSSVEADRTVNVNVEGDGSAFLQFSPADSTNAAKMTDGTLEIALDSTLGESGSGLNINATTTINPIFTITNGGSQPVNMQISDVTADSGSASIANNQISNTLTDNNGYNLNVDYEFTATGNENASAGDTIIGSAVGLSPGDSIQLKLNVILGSFDDAGSGDPDPSTLGGYLTRVTFDASV